MNGDRAWNFARRNGSCVVIGIAWRYRDDAGIDHSNYLLFFGIPHHHEPFDGMPAMVGKSTGDGTDHSLQAATLLFGGAEVTRRTAVTADCFEVGDAAFAQGCEYLRICFYFVVDSLGFVFDQDRLDAFDFFPRDQFSIAYVDDRFKRASSLLDDGQRFAPCWIAGLPVQHFGLGRLVQVDSGIAALGRQFFRGLQGLEDCPIFFGGECIERMSKIGGGAADRGKQNYRDEYGEMDAQAQPFNPASTPFI